VVAFATAQQLAGARGLEQMAVVVGGKVALALITELLLVALEVTQVMAAMSIAMAVLLHQPEALVDMVLVAAA
jgi:hypothetical protein